MPQFAETDTQEVELEKLNLQQQMKVLQDNIDN
jgi:hypothetical protein